MDSFKPNDNFKYYLKFISERMNIFWGRYNNLPQPWTNDKVLQDHKFTNVYRVLDRSSQYLISNVIQNGKEYSEADMAWRIILYKHFNLQSTWDALIKEFGDISLNIKTPELTKFFHKYSKTGVIYSNAYMITASFMRSESIIAKYGLVKGMPKYQTYFRLFHKGFFEDGVLMDILISKTMEEAFTNFSRIVGIADFLAYQLVQDLNYSNIVNWDDNSFCAAGPGTERGILRTFDIKGKPDYQEIVKWIHSNFEQLLEDYNIDFKPLPNHMPTVPDLSNCLCEVDKYMRGLGIVTDGIPESRIKQKFRINNQKINYIFPDKWAVKI